LFPPSGEHIINHGVYLSSSEIAKLNSVHQHLHALAGAGRGAGAGVTPPVVGLTKSDQMTISLCITKE